VSFSEVWGEAPPVPFAAELLPHSRAHDAAARTDLAAARRAARRAQTVLSWHTAVAIHNANPQLAIEALIAQLAAQDRVS
jgi:hypothetical protein